MPIPPSTAGPWTILCVDDDAYLTDLMQYALTREGYIVQIASSATAARQALRALHPDLVILGLTLPDAGGYELCSEIRDIRYLRTKLTAVFETRQVIHTVRGLGYTFHRSQQPSTPREEAAG